MKSLKSVARILADLVILLGLGLRPQVALAAENLFLSKQLAMYPEHMIKPRRPDRSTRTTLALLSRLFNWRNAITVVQQRTLIGWHRQGFKLFWRLKSRPGRPPIPKELRQFIREMALSNPSWGEERIANELLLKGTSINCSPVTAPAATVNQPRKHVLAVASRGPASFKAKPAETQA